MQPLGQLGSDAIQPSIQEDRPLVQMPERSLVGKKQILSTNPRILLATQAIESGHDSQLACPILEIDQLAIELPNAGLEVLIDLS